MNSTQASQKPDPKFSIFLCFGQSNMEGGAKLEDMDRVGNKRFQVMADFDNPSREWKKGIWYEAVPPLLSFDRFPILKACPPCEKR